MPWSSKSSTTRRAPCPSCGLSKSSISFTLSPFQTQSYGLSPESRAAANRFVQECQTAEANLHNAIQRLKRRQTHVRALLKQHLPYLEPAPVHRLPEEVLVLIFSQVCWARGTHFPTPPWEISAVCKRWRTVATSCPLLWSHLRFAPGDAAANPRLHAARLLAQLQRAKPETVPLECMLFDAPSHIQWINVARSLLCHTVPKCKSLQLRGPIHPNALPQDPPSFGSLLELHVLNDSWMVQKYLSDTPALATLKLEGLTLCKPRLFPKERLACLELDGCKIPADTLLSMLSLAPNLTSLVVAYSLHQVPVHLPSHLQPDPHPPVHLSKLQRLDLKLTEAEDEERGDQLQAQSFLRRLTAPNLVELTAMEFRSHGALASLQEFIINSDLGGTLRSVFVDVLLATGCQPVIELLHRLPAIQKLSLSSCDDCDLDPVLQALAWPQEAQMDVDMTTTDDAPAPEDDDVLLSLQICPDLRSLGVWYSNMTIAALTKMMESRLPSRPGDTLDNRACMQKLEIWGPPFDADKGDPLVQVLAEAHSQGILEFAHHKE